MNSSTFIQFSLVTASAITSSAHAQENENAVPLLLGMESESTEIEKISVQLDGRIVTVSTLLRNSEATARRIGWYASTPQFSILGNGEEHLDKTFADVRSTVNETKSMATVYQRGYFMGRDITSELIRAGLNPLPNLDSDAKKVARITSVNMLKIENWQGYANYAWYATLPPDSKTTVKVSYRALPSFALAEVNSGNFSDAIRQHCGDESAVRHRVQAAVGAIPQVIIESYEVPITYLRMREVNVNVVSPRMNWLHAHPVVSIACGLKNKAQLANVKGTISNGNNVVSIMIISVPQKLIAPDEDYYGK